MTPTLSSLPKELLPLQTLMIVGFESSFTPLIGSVFLLVNTRLRKPSFLVSSEVFDFTAV